MIPRFDRSATLYFSLPLTRLLGPRQRIRVPILMYHSISDNFFGKSHPYFQIHTSAAVFSQQMRWLRHAGYRTLTLAEAWAGLEAGANLSKTVVITFDDGYRDFYTEAMDVLKQCGFKATVFLATDRIQNVPARIAGADYLTWSEVRELHAEGVQFGSHTVTHPDLRSLDPEQMEYELGCSKESIEQHLGAPVESFSYPSAFPEEDKGFTRFFRDLLENQGFENGVSTIIGCAGREHNKFFLPRLPVNDWDDSPLLRAKLDGGYDWLHWAQILKKSIFHMTPLMQRSPNVESWGRKV